MVKRKPTGGFTVEEVALVFEVDAETVRVWVRKGKLKGIKYKKRWYINVTEVQRLVQERYGSK